MSDDLNDFVHGLDAMLEAEKTAGSDLSALSDDELAFIAFGEKAAADEAAAPGSGLHEGPVYDGGIDSGSSANPDWPRAAMGVDGAGRKATPEELKNQNDTATPQHVEPKTAGVLQAAKRLGLVNQQGLTPLGVGSVGATVGVPIVANEVRKARSKTASFCAPLTASLLKALAGS